MIKPTKINHTRRYETMSHAKSRSEYVVVLIFDKHVYKTINKHPNFVITFDMVKPTDAQQNKIQTLI